MATTTPIALRYALDPMDSGKPLIGLTISINAQTNGAGAVWSFEPSDRVAELPGMGDDGRREFNAEGEGIISALARTQLNHEPRHGGDLREKWIPPDGGQD